MNTNPSEQTVPATFGGKDQNQGNSTINSPLIDEKTGKPTQRAISTAGQAHSIAKNLRDRAKVGRIATAAIIADKYNGTPPFSAQKLSDEGSAWRNNFSTNWLASIIDRVTPQMLDPINKSDTLTHSALPAGVDNAASKSRTFCEVTTKVIRAWPEWRDFASQLSKEVVLYGTASPAWIDSPTEWRPRLWRYDEAFLPEGTGQHSSKVQIAVFSQKMLLHEFMELFADKAIAEKACYNYDNCITAANTTTNQGQSRAGDETMLEREDRLREGSPMVTSYDTKARTVDLYHVIVRDWTGEIDLWTVTQDNGMEIRCVEGLHESMEDAISLFTFQSGNGKFYGSKGLGRLLTNLHIAIERGRNLGADQMYLSGLIIFQGDPKDSAAMQAVVRHPFVFLPRSWTVVESQIEFKVEAFEAMDAKFNQIGESIAGAFIPPNLNDQGANTKIEAAQNAVRQLAVKEGVLGRFFDHLSDLVSGMQRKIYCSVNLREGKRAYDAKVAKQAMGIVVLARKVWKLLKAALGAQEKSEPDMPEGGVADESAVSAIVQLLEGGLTIEDIAILALSPSAQSNATDGASKDQDTMQFIQANQMNPFMDHRAATEMWANIAIGKDRADQLIIKQDDPQVDAIATRQQIIEASEMIDGEAMPVADSDQHDVHRKVLMGKLSGVMQGVTTAPTPAIIKSAMLMISHYVDHIQKDVLMPPDQKTQEMKAMQGFWNTAQQMGSKLAQDAAQNPVPVNGQPPQVGPDGHIVGERQSIHPDDAKLKLEIHKAQQEDKRIALQEQGQQLEAQKIAHDQRMDQIDAEQKGIQGAHDRTIDALKLHQDTAGMVQQAGQDGLDSAHSTADRNLQAQIAQQQAAIQQQAAATQAQEGAQES